MSNIVLETSLVLVLMAAGLLALGAFFASKKQLLPMAVLAPAAGLVFVLGLALGFLTVKKKAREVRAGWNLTPVLVASRDLAAGAFLTSDAVSEMPVPEQFVTASLFRDRTRSRALGRTLVGPVKRGEPISELLVGIDLEGCRAAKEAVGGSMGEGRGR